ncbi:MAG: ABC transporter substrate-binding protein [Kiritimatiellae bacterium]|nr:ABC transporter substrate-binding protein [Kiritimatiellia bacterium]
MDRTNGYLAAGMAACLGLSALGLSRCDNSPYPPADRASRTLFLYSVTPTSKLDPATSYYTHEGDVIDNIYEPPFDYHYLKRPYELIPLIAERIPEAVCRDAHGEVLPAAAPDEQVARVEYVIPLRKGIRYQPHPCFARGPDGAPLYRNLTSGDLRGIETPNDFPVLGTREVVAGDIVFAIRRLADPRIACPIQQTLGRSIAGFSELGNAYEDRVSRERERRKAEGGPAYDAVADERERPIVVEYMSPEFRFEGAQAPDDYTLKIVLTRRYPQILYWMAMHFFAPLPHEALEFYAQAPLAEKQMSINTWPVGSGPYLLSQYDPTREIVLARNPNFEGRPYPSEGEPDDAERGLLRDAGRTIPLNDRVVMTLEKEPIPQWNKFLQGYYDVSAITPEAFDRAVSLSTSGDATLTPELASKGIQMTSAVSASMFYFGFNMRDDTVGGLTDRGRKLRQAISIALDYQEYLDIFANGQGVVAQDPIPPGIFGSRTGPEGVNPFTDVWDAGQRRPRRRSLDDARRLLGEAGYPNGRTPDGHSLVIYLDHSQGGEPTFVSRFEWMRQRLALIGIDLQERGTELKRFREKMDQGAFMTCMMGWSADYPDPENFLFLYYGPNSRVDSGGGGENSTNYRNPEYDALFSRMEAMSNGPERQEIIDRMLAILREDAPMCFGYFPRAYVLYHSWLRNGKTHLMSRNIYQYRWAVAEDRVRRQTEWNRPRILPILALEALFLAGLWPAIQAYRRSERGGAVRC